MIKNLLLAGLGGCIGSMMRMAVYLLLKSTAFPFATFIINIAGSLLIGIIIGISVNNQSFNNNWRIFLATGICGGFTTFSAFSFENIELMQQGKFALSLLYITGSVVIGIAAAWIGYKMVN